MTAKRKEQILVCLLTAAAVLLGTLLLFLTGRVRSATNAPATETVSVSETVTEVQQPTAEAAAAADDSLPYYSLELETVLYQTERSAGVWDIYCENLTTGAYAELHSGQPMVSASLIKLFIMGAVYDSFGTECMNADAYTDLRSMITQSDNQAANRLIELLGDGDADAGMQKVNTFAKRMGCSDTALNRLMLVDNGLQNYTTAADCALLLKQIAAGICVSEKASAEMLELLKGQQVSNGLPDLLPEGTECAHKTGNLTAICVGDCGIIYAGEQSWVLCAICNEQTDEVSPQNSIRSLSQDVYRYFCAEPAANP